MSVPAVLLSVLDQPQTPAATTTTTPAAIQLDDHKSCASYVDAAAVASSVVVAPQYVTTTADTLNSIETSTLTCSPTVRPFTVHLKTALAPNERIGLTGDSKALGEWLLDRCVTLLPLSELEWRANVVMQACRNINYRYFIYVEDAAGRKQIRRWETHFQPRKLTTCVNMCRQTDEFGVAANGATQVNRGWLTNDSIVQFKFEREQMFQVHDIEKFDPEQVQLKLVPLNCAFGAADDGNDEGLNIEVVKHDYGASQLQPQQPFGIAYTRGEIVIFHVTVLHPVMQSFAIEFYSPAELLIGRAIIDCTRLLGSEGMLKLTIESVSETEDDGETIALLNLPYVVVKPFAEDAELNFQTTYAHYWPKSWPNLDIGHRGNGKSYIANPPAERENTLASFMRAYERYADMVEFDVHLTADGVPVIYHDFGLRTAPMGKKITSAAQLEYVLIKDLRYESLKNLRVFAVINDEVKEYPAHNAEPRIEHRIFPTLRDVLQGLPKTLGMDIEIKWPQLRASGNYEAEQTIDKNFFADRVLQTVISYSCGRPLIFSSFDADMCTMLRFKQNMYPVMFLSMGETKKWQPFMDLRTRNFVAAINNAQAFELAGTAPHAEDFLSENGAKLMQKALDVGQIAVVWGDDCNSKERVKYFTEIGATATCYDRSDLYMPDHKERAFFNSTSLIAEFEAQCRT